MVFKSLLFLSLAAISLAAPSPSSLRVTITPAATSAKSKDISLTATVANPTAEDIKFVRFGSVLDTLPTRSFKVTKDGKEVAFAGMSVFPDLEHEDSWVTVPAGKSVTVDHKIGFDYDFVAAGPGKYSFEPLTTFQFGTTPSEIARVQSSTVEVDITEVEGPVEIAQTTPVCSDGNKLNFLRASLSEARALAGGGATDVRSHPNSGQFRSYFGNSNRDTVWYLLDRIAGDLASSGVRDMYCGDGTRGTCAGNPGIVAYVLLVTSGGNIISSNVYACNPFWSFPVTHDGICQGRLVNTRGGVILHELSHAVGGTTDIYGCANVQGIPDAQKIKNADNYACFGSQIHRDYNC